MQLVWADRSQPITGGFVLSVLFHVGLAVAALVVIPLFHVEIDTTPPGIEATIVSDITAAPKVDKAGKLQDKPKPPTPPAPEQQKPEPPKPAPPATPTPAASAPPAAEQQAVVVPDDSKAIEPKKDEKKQPDKKPEKKPEDKPKPKKDDTQAAMDALLNNLTKQQPAPDTKDKTKSKAQPAPAQPTVGPQTMLTTEGPAMTQSENDAIRAQIIPNWNPSEFMGAPDLGDMVIELRVWLQPDGTVTNVQVLNSDANPFFQVVAASAVRAVQKTSPLKLPPGKTWATMQMEFRPAEALNQ